MKKISNTSTQYSHISKRISTRWSPEEMKKLGLTKKREQEHYTSKSPNKKAKNRLSMPIDLKNHPLSQVMKSVIKDHTFHDGHSPIVSEFLRRVRKEWLITSLKYIVSKKHVLFYLCVLFLILILIVCNNLLWFVQWIKNK